MITAMLLSMMFTLLNIAVFWIDPITELPFGLSDAIETVYSLVHSGILVFPPLGTAMVYFILAITIEGLYYGYRLAKQIFEWIASLK